MTLFSRAWANFSTVSMAVPARIALWMGLLLLILGKQTHQGVVSVVGIILILIGVALWGFFGPKKVKSRFVLGVAQKIRGLAIVKRFSRTSQKEALAAAILAAQKDPKLQAKRLSKRRD